MQLTVNRNIGNAPYEQIKQQLRESILSGKISEDSPLPSVREIVQSAGVSLATAQRALNELKTEGFVYVKPGRGTFAAPKRFISIEKIHIFLPSTHLSFFMEILSGINSALEGQPIETILHSLDTDKLLWDWKTIEALDAARSEQAGIIFIEEATGAVRDTCRKAAAAIPFVTIEWKLENAPAVVNNYRESTANAMQYLIRERGCRNIAILKGRDYQYNAREKLAGIEHEAGLCGLARDQDIFYLDTDFDAFSGYTAVHEILKTRKVDAVFCANDYEAIGVIGALTEANLLAGKDVALIGYGDMTDKTTLYFPLTTVNQQLQEMGKHAVEALMAAAAAPANRTAREIVVPALLEIRKT